MSSTASPAPPGDWQSESTVLQSNRYMFDHEIECDVTFTLLPAEEGAETVSVRAHKFVLISRSPVFFAMLSGPLAESQSNIRVPDISPEAFSQLLRFMYCEEVSLTTDNVFEVLYASKKYLVNSLTKRCLEHMQEMLTPANVCHFVENSFLIEDHPNLMKSCWDVVEKQSKNVFNSDAFFQLSPQGLSRVLATENLSVHEIDVFRACNQWAERRCRDVMIDTSSANKRQSLEGALRRVHFPTMNLGEFTKIVIPTGLLSTEEENCIFRCLSSTNCTDTVPAIPFPTRSRECVSMKCSLDYDTFISHTSSSYGAHFSGFEQRSKWSLTFHVDHSVKLQEIGFIGTFKGSMNVTQGNDSKYEVACDAHMQDIKLDDSACLSLDAGTFVVSCDNPFSYHGTYFSKSVSSRPLPNTVPDPGGRVGLHVRDCSAISFLSYLVVMPTDELHFVDDFFEES